MAPWGAILMKGPNSSGKADAPFLARTIPILLVVVLMMNLLPTGSSGGIEEPPITRSGVLPVDEVPLPISVPELDPRYVIICPEEFKEEVIPLAVHRIRLGMPSRVYTIESIEENFTGVDREQKVHNFLRSMHQNHSSFKWLFIVGDSEHLRPRALWHYAYDRGQPFHNYYYSDVYYAGLDHDWDTDKDGRFGEYSKTASPGLNFKIPLVDSVVKVDIETVRKEEFGFRTKVPGQKSIFQREGFDAESLMLTADKNVIDVEWIVQYKVQDPFNFLFKVQDVRQAVRDVSETALRRVIGNMDFDYVLSNREILASLTDKEMQAELDNYETGVKIVTVQLQDVNPPDAVKPAFNEVNEADQDMKRLVNEAEEAYNRVIPKARGEALQIVEEASGYAAQRVNESKGDTARFLAILKEYKTAKDVTRKRMYLETMQDILPSVTDIYVIDKEQRSILPFLNVGGAQPK